MNKSPAICIVDYGVGNLHSAVKALRRFSDRVTVSEEPEAITAADAVVLPGVGSFGAGMRGLDLRGLARPIKEFAKSEKPILGICLGAQLLLERGYEMGEFEGLGIIPGEVRPFPTLATGVKVPHIGWSELLSAGCEWGKTILDGLPPRSQFYFVHSYLLEPKRAEDILAKTSYGGHRFCSVMRRGAIYGCQFHPEKSGEGGLKIIENFLTKVS